MTITKPARMKCTRYIGSGLPAVARDIDPALLPPLDPPGNLDLTAASDWLAHVQAGRIPVR